MLAAIAVTLRRKRGIRGVWPTLWRTIATGGAIVGLIVLGVAAYPIVFPSEYIVQSGVEPLLEAEIRLPAGAFVPADRNFVRIRLDTDKSQHDAVLDDDWKRTEADGRIVLTGRIPLYFRTRQRIVSLRIPTVPDRVFLLDLAADPRRASDYGAWRPETPVTKAGGGQARAPAAGTAAEIRVRVVPR
jgi:hypothetical protein